MSAVSTLHEQHAAAKQRLAIARDEAASRLSEYERASKQNAAQLADMEAAYIAYTTSEALGTEPTQDLPDATILEKLRADVSVAEPVRRQLERNLEARETALKTAEAEHKATVAEYLRRTALQPALIELEKAFGNLREAAVDVIAAHKLAYRVFEDNPTPANSPCDYYGPVAEWLGALHGLQWSSHPYDIRPAWLPRGGRFYPDEMQGVSERVNQLLAQVEEASA